MKNKSKKVSEVLLETGDPRFVPLKTYLRHTQRLTSNSGGFFDVLRNYSLLMSKLESYMLADLYNREDRDITGWENKMEEMVSTKDGKILKIIRPPFDKAGYFMRTREYLNSPDFPPKWSFGEQRRLIPRLQEKGFIKIKQKGWPSHRYIKVRRLYIQTQLDKITPDWTEFLDLTKIEEV